MAAFSRSFEAVDLHEPLKDVISSAAAIEPETPHSQILSFSNALGEVQGRMATPKEQLNELHREAPHILLGQHVKSAFSHITHLEKWCDDMREAFGSSELDAITSTLGRLEQLRDEAGELDGETERLKSVFGEQ